MNELTDFDIARLLSDSLKYVRLYRSHTVVGKYGGNAMKNPELQQQVMHDLVLLSMIGIRIVLVHGGGPSINKSLAALGIESKFVRGLRVTDEETMRVVQRVLAGETNKDLVNKIERIGIERAKKSMEKADLIMAVIDGSRPLSEEDRALLTSLYGRKALVILNKYDLPQEIETRDVKALAGDIPVVPISARYGSGMAELEEELHHITRLQDVSAGRELFLTNLRHVDLVKKALAAACRAEESIRCGMPADCIVVDVTEAWHTLGEITGDTVDQELINSIFERFCVGK